MLWYKNICWQQTHSTHSTTHSTRRSNDLHLPHVHTNWGKQTFLYEASKDWNKLDNDMKNFMSSSFFRQSLKICKKCLSNCWASLLSLILQYPFLGNFSLFYFIITILQCPSENSQSEWAPWINIVIIIRYSREFCGASSYFYYSCLFYLSSFLVASPVTELVNKTNRSFKNYSTVHTLWYLIQFFLFPSKNN